MNKGSLSIEEAMIQTSKENEELYKKELELKQSRINRQHEEMLERKRQAENAENVDVSNVDDDRIKKLVEINQDYLIKARNSKVFINNDFKAKIPYFPRNVILVAAQTGEGKSTTCANLAYHALCQKQKVLVITNEENIGDVYNRTTCLLKGWSYADHTKFTDDQVKVFGKMIGILSQRMTVIDDSFNGEMNQTTSVEGIESIFQSLIKSEKKYDVIIIDYYQNIDKSIKVPENDGWKAQERFCKLLDSFKNNYDAPIVILAQKKQNSENISFKESIEGRKMILNVSTCAIEVKADRELLKTDWIIRKSRFAGSVGETIHTGYRNGMYVPYDSGFKLEVEHLRQKRKVSMTIAQQLGRKK